MSPTKKTPIERDPELDSAAAQTVDEAAAQPADEVEPTVEIPAGAEWYVVHSYSGYENKVRQNLSQRIESMGMQNKIFRVVVPTEEEVEIRDGKKRSSRKRVFPGYILVHMVLDEESWYVVRNTPGVTGFVGSGTTPTPLRPEEVDKILKRMEEETPRIRVNFRIGETVRIVEGPFADFMGVVDEIYAERGKVRVLVSFFGRETPVEMDFLQVDRT
jgi:transcriptional antiterminator NusG